MRVSLFIVIFFVIFDFFYLVFICLFQGEPQVCDTVL